MILPGKIRVPAAPTCLLLARSRLFSGQAEIANRNDMLSGAAAILIGEGVELFDIAKRQTGLPLDPGAQSRLE